MCPLCIYLYLISIYLEWSKYVSVSICQYQDVFRTQVIVIPISRAIRRIAVLHVFVWTSRAIVLWIWSVSDSNCPLCRGWSALSSMFSGLAQCILYLSPYICVRLDKAYSLHNNYYDFPLGRALFCVRQLALQLPNLNSNVYNVFQRCWQG